MSAPRRPRPKFSVELSADQHRLILDTINDPVHMVDRDLRILFINRHFMKWLRRLGIKKEVRGRTVREAFPFLPEAVFEEYRKVFRSRATLLTEEAILIRGKVLHTETQKIPILENGRTAGVVTVIHDITARKEAQNELRRLNEELDSRVRERAAQLQESDEKHRTLLDHLPVGVYRTTPDGRILQANRALAGILGFPDMKALEKVNIGDLYADPLDRRAHLGVLRRKGTEPREFTLRRRDGTPVWVRDYPRTIRDSRGRIRCFDGILVDISKRKRAERALEITEGQYRDLVESANSIILRLDPKGRITFWNRFAAKFFGFKTAEVLNKPAVGTIVPVTESTGRSLRKLLADICRRPERYTNNINENVKKNGERVWISWTNRPIRDEEGGYAGVLCVGNDLTRLKKAEEALHRSHGKLEERVAERTRELTAANRELKREITERRHTEQILTESEERFRDFFDRNAAASFISTADGRLLQCNEAFLRLFGFNTMGEALASEGRALYMNPADRESFLAKLRNQRSLTLEEMTYRGRDGGRLMVLENAVGIFDKAGKLRQIHGFLLDVTQLKDAEDRLAHLLQHDLLTGLPNRSLLLDRMEQAIARAHRSGESMGLAVLDLDHFNAVNDALGHYAGDRLLQVLTQRLKDHVADADTLAHLGGDEFALLFADLKDPEVLSSMPARIQGVLSHPYLLESQEIYVGASIGIAFYPQDAGDPETLLKNAEVAMFRAKEQGGSHSQYYRPEMNVLNLERLMMETSLRKALERGEFRLHYQPLVDLKTRRIIGLEALLRWQHPELGLLYPASFIPLAEEKGFIVPMGEWAMKEACVQARRWLDQKFSLQRLTVNISARQFETQDLPALIERILTESKLEPDRLELELTENMIMANVSESMRIMHALKRLGIHLAIDDFGTGYSSLFYLKKHFPIDTLKIDRYFLKDFTPDSDDAAIIRAIIALGQSLRLRVVAEGVETVEQVEFLKDNGCHIIQGFICSRPQEPDIIGKYLKDGRCPAAF